MKLAPFALVAFVLVAFARPSPLQHAGLELFENGGFEDGLAGWRTLNMSGGTLFEIDKRVWQSGQNGLRIERTGTPGRVDFLKQSADLGGRSGTVEVSLAYRLNDEGRFVADAYFFDGAGRTIGDGYVTLVEADKKRGNFKTARRALEIPAGATGVGLNVKVDRRGTVWIDDVSVLLFASGGDGRAVSTGTLANGTFDKNLDGWVELEHGSKRSRATCDRKARLAGGGGGGALRLERRSPRLFPEDGVRAVVATDAEAVRVEFRAAREGDARAFVTLVADDGHGVPLASVRVEGDLGGVDFEPPPGTRRITVLLTVGGAGTVWFDDVTLEEVGS